MFLFYFSIALTIFANVLYHVFQKSISQNVNPIISLIATYVTSLTVCLLILPFYPSQTSGFFTSLKQLNWASFALGFGIIGLEMGFLLAYRAGWNISIAVTISTAIVSLLLIPIGLLFFKEKLTLINSLGFFFCIIGIIFLNWK